MSYEYLVASLPLLFWGHPPPFPTAEFRRRCAGVLSPEDLAALDRLLDGRPDPEAPGFEGAWAARETQLRNAAAAARAARTGGEARAPHRPHPGWDGGIEKSVTDAFVKESPIEREMELDRGRWRAAEDLARGRPFGVEAVFAFAVRLRIAERWAALTDAAGRARFDALLAGLTAQVRVTDSEASDEA